MLNDSDVDGDVIAVQPGVITTAQGVALTLAVDGSFTYTPLANFNGEDSFEYTVEDMHGNTAMATATLDVIAVNDAPVAQDDMFDGVSEQQITGNVLIDNGNGADSDIDGDALSVVAGTYTTSQNGTITLNADGSFSYVSAAGFVGTDSFNYTVEDPSGATGMAGMNCVIRMQVKVLRST